MKKQKSTFSNCLLHLYINYSRQWQRNPVESYTNFPSKNQNKSLQFSMLLCINQLSYIHCELVSEGLNFPQLH